MEEHGLCRYVGHTATQVVTGITGRPGAGPSFRLEEHLWLIPVTWQDGGRLLLTGEVRVREIGTTTEVLLVVEEAHGDTTPDELLDELLAGFGLLPQ